MQSLLIDACTDRGYVAIIQDDQLSYFAGLPVGLHNSRFLLPKIDEGFKSLKLEAKDFDYIVVANGPGSYTGIRVGVVVAKTLSYAAKVPLIGISALSGFIPDCPGKFAAIFDAKMGGCYLQKGERKGNDICSTSSPEVWSMDHLNEKLEDVDLLVTPTEDILRKKFADYGIEDRWEWEESAPDPLYLNQLAKEKYAAKEYSTDGTVDILYMR